MKNIAIIMTNCFTTLLISIVLTAGSLDQTIISTPSLTICEPSAVADPPDTVSFAKVVIYRPDNQLSRKYQIRTDQHAPFSLKKKEERTLEIPSNVLELEISATANRSERFSFVLSKDKVHYLRVQDRNNYSGMRPFLEIIEVAEDTYLKDGMRTY
jgi:hypothetical protein